ncbi:MAG: hypothetical protein HYV09_26365 [Deltaproteobacteria bacterium]|nr:hypothetical protein [Deltaproteobacteria bacterium]
MSGSDDNDDPKTPPVSAAMPVASPEPPEPPEPRDPRDPPITRVIAKSLGEDDVRFARAWRVWLEALAHDPEAAWAAALTYRSLPVDGREAWIDALDVDAPDVGAPAIALYAPLLGVEDDPGRRARIEAALLKHGAPVPQNVLRALVGEHSQRRIIVIINPLYLDFVEVLTCVMDGDAGFHDVRHDPIRRAAEAPKEGDVIDGVELEARPMEVVIEELAHAVVAHRRNGGKLSLALVRFADLFTPRPESVDRDKLGDR